MRVAVKERERGKEVYIYIDVNVKEASKKAKKMEGRKWKNWKKEGELIARGDGGGR